MVDGAVAFWEGTLSGLAAQRAAVRHGSARDPGRPDVALRVQDEDLGHQAVRLRVHAAKRTPGPAPSRRSGSWPACFRCPRLLLVGASVEKKRVPRNLRPTMDRAGRTQPTPRRWPLGGADLHDVGTQPSWPAGRIPPISAAQMYPGRWSVRRVPPVPWSMPNGRTWSAAEVGADAGRSRR